MAVLGGAVVASPVAAQNATGGDVEVRIVARKLESGRVEFGLQQRQRDDSWGDRQLPRIRFFPTGTTVGRWLASSPLDLPAGEVRIVARKLESGRVEFGLQQRQRDDSWGDRQLPRIRFFPTGTTVGRWLASSSLTLTTAEPADGATADGQPRQGGDSYRDVRADAPYAEAVAALAEDGVFAGTLCESGFCPDDPIDSKAMAVWVVRVFDGEDPAGTYETGRHGSVADGFHAPFIERMADLEHISECGDAQSYAFIDSGRKLTRAEAVAFLAAVFCLPRGADSGYSDVPVTAWYAGDVARAAAWGITEGCSPDGRFCPERDTTRADMAAFLWRVENPPHPEGPPDRAARQEPRELNPAMGGGGVISAGRWHACGLRSDRTVACWGLHFDDRLNVPPFRFLGVAAGSSAHACGVRVDQTLTCWGHWPLSGQGALPSGQFPAATPGYGLLVDAPPLGRFTAVAAGFGHSCGLRLDGTIDCWWSHENNEHDERINFGQVNAPSGRFTAVSAGVIHSCAIGTDETVTCWGDNSSGQADPPSGRFTAVSLGSNHSCGIRTDETATCWGDNSSGQAGAPSGRFTAISAGGDNARGFSCGIRIDQSIACWGDNNTLENIRRGRVRVTSHVVRDAPAGRFTAISAGNSGFACAVRTDGTVECWGAYAEDGRLLDPSAAVWFSQPVVTACPREPSGGAKPNRPAGVQLTPTGAIDADGHLARPATVRWASPCGGARVDHYLVQWRRGHEDFDGARQRTVKATDSAGVYSFKLRDRFVYAVRVIAVNSSGRTSSTELMIPSPANKVRMMIAAVVTTHQDRYAWLTDVWLYMNQLPTRIEASYCVYYLSPVFSSYSSCATGREIRVVYPYETIGLEDTLVHELVHVYDNLVFRQVYSKDYYGDAEQAIHNAATLVAARLYLKAKFPECPVAELLADMPGMLMNRDGVLKASVVYWYQCAVTTTGSLTRFWESASYKGAYDVARSVFENQEVPQWFYDTYQRADGSWDVAAIEADSGEWTSVLESLRSVITEQ